VCGDLTSCFNFATPNSSLVLLPSTAGFLPTTSELAGGSPTTFSPTGSQVTFGIPAQEKGIRPAKALPYALNVQATVNTSSSTVTLTFINTGSAAVVFQVRSVNPSDVVRNYTVGPGSELSDSWNVTTTYGLSVYGPNGFVRYFNGSIGASAAILSVSSAYLTANGGSISWTITNSASTVADVNVVNAYTGNIASANLQPNQTLSEVWNLAQFYGWYDVVITVSGDSTFQYRLAGHVETGSDSYSDPAMGGLVTLQPQG
jgi:phospholipase C